MINQVVNSADKKVFAPLRTNGADYAITKPFTDTQIKEQKKDEEKKESKLGHKITKYSLLAGFGLLIILGGATPFGRNSFKKLLDKIGDKLRIVKNKENKSVKEKLSEKILKGTHNLLLKMKATYNLASLKDIAVKRGLSKVPFLDKIGQSITNLFERISIKTSMNAYNKTHKKLGKMVSFMDEIQAGIKNLSADDLKKLTNNRDEIINATHNFDIPAQKQRINDIKNYFYGKDEKETNSLANRVWEKTWGHLNNFGLKSKMYDTFITEWLVKEKKLEFHNKVQASRVLITNDLRDTYSLTNRLMQELEPYHELKEGEGKKTIEKVKTTLGRMKKRLDSKEEKRKGLLDSGLAWNLGEIKEILKNSNEKGNEKICESINAVVKILNTNTKGAVQRNLDIYKKYYKDNPAEYEKIKKEIYKGVHSLHHSIKLEDELFDKIRDLSIGSAPKDTIAVLGSAGVVGWYLNKADNKDEKISVALKYGIPTIGAVATALYCTVGLVSGGSSLIIGLLSGVAISKVGTYADYLRKKYKEKHLSMNDITIPNSILPTKYIHVLAHDKSSLQPTNKSSS